MGGEWHRCRLGEVVDINPDVVGSDWPFNHIKYIDISSVGEGAITEPPKRIPLSKAPSRARRLVKAGDTVLSTVRPGRRSMFFVRETIPDLVVSTGFAVLRPRTDRVDPRFLYACVFDRSFTSYLVSREKGAAYPAVLPSDIAEAVIPFPPLPEQRAIAHILSTLDDKIELNRRMNETLEAMAQTLFKSWFVDFDPVVVNALKAGNPIPDKFAERAAHYRDNPDALGLPEHILRLFPDRFRDSELGPIPEGWEVTEIKNCCTKVQNGGTPRKSQIEYWQPGTIPWLTSSEVRQTIIAETENMISELGFEKSSAKWLPKDSTVVALYGATAGQVALISLDLTTNQAVCGLIPKPFYRYFNYLHLKRSVRLLANLARGSAQQNISKRIVEMTKVVLPNKAIIKSFDQEISPVFDKWVANLLESRTLAALRDTLLPKLISGELRVPDVEKILEGVE